MTSSAVSHHLLCNCGCALDWYLMIADKMNEAKLFGLFEEIGEKFKIIKKLEMLLEKKMNVKNPCLDYIRYQQLNWYGHVQRMNG